jgi:hypothetical protein
VVEGHRSALGTSFRSARGRVGGSSCAPAPQASSPPRKGFPPPRAGRQGGRAQGVVYAPAAANGHVAIAAAEVETDQGVFTGLGEAAPGDGRRPGGTALPRLAETRAKAQALADAVNVGLPVFEARAPAPGAGAPRGRP